MPNTQNIFNEARGRLELAKSTVAYPSGSYEHIPIEQIHEILRAAVEDASTNAHQAGYAAGFHIGRTEGAKAASSRLAGWLREFATSVEGAQHDPVAASALARVMKQLRAFADSINPPQP